MRFRLNAGAAPWAVTVSNNKYIVPSEVKKYAYLSQPEEIWRELRVPMSLGTKGIQREDSMDTYTHNMCRPGF